MDVTTTLKLAAAGTTLLALSCGAWLSSMHFNSGYGGKFKLQALGILIQNDIGKTNLPQLLEAKQNDRETRALVKSTFNLYEPDAGLLREIKNMDYDSEFSKGLRTMRDHLLGPFNSPEVKIELSFSDHIQDARAQVCPDSNFLNQSINIRTSDRTNMNLIENANELLVIDCPTEVRRKNGKLERIVVARNFGERLLKTETPPTSIEAVAKALPSIRFITSNQLETFK